MKMPTTFAELRKFFGKLKKEMHMACKCRKKKKKKSY